MLKIKQQFTEQRLLVTAHFCFGRLLWIYIPSIQAIRTLPTAWVPPHRKSRLRLMKGSSGTKGAKDAP